MVDSLGVEPGLWGARASAAVAGRFSSCSSHAMGHRLDRYGTQTQLFCSVWNLPGPGVKPVAPALANGFLPTEPPRKSLTFQSYLNHSYSCFLRSPHITAGISHPSIISNTTPLLSICLVWSINYMVTWC